MSFNYEQSIWGRGEAELNWSNPTNVRLRHALKAIQLLPPGANVLEVGCGAGQFIRAIKQLRPELVCFGSDISHEAIQQAKQRGGGAEYAVSQPYQFPYQSNSQDALVLFDVLEHVDEPRRLLAEVNRVLKPGGILYAFVPCEGDSLSLWHWLAVVNLKRELTKKYAGHVQYFSRQSLIALVQGSGFAVKHIRFSEHCLGQWVGVIAFFLMDRAARRSFVVQLNNEAYFESVGSGALIGGIKKLVNIAVTVESLFLSLVPSPNVHLVLIKN